MHDDASEKSGGSQQTRKENNLRKIILALLERSKLQKADLTKLSGELEGILDKLAIDRGDKRFALSADKIEERLEEARDLYLI